MTDMVLDGKKKTKKEKKTHLQENTMQEDIKKELDVVINELESQGISSNSHKDDDVAGLGDVVEGVLDKFGITEERFKQWFNLSECDCSKRKKFLNNLFGWKKNQ